MNILWIAILIGIFLCIYFVVAARGRASALSSHKPEVNETWIEKDKPADPWERADTVRITDTMQGWVKFEHEKAWKTDNNRYQTCKVGDFMKFYERYENDRN